MPDERPVEQHTEGQTYADTKKKQDEFEELLRERESEQDDDTESEDFQEAVDDQRAGKKPETPPTSTPTTL